MASIPPDVLLKFTESQPIVWQAVSTAATEAMNRPISFESINVTTVSHAAIQAEFPNETVVIQFAFSDLPENPQIVVLDEASAVAVASLLKQGRVETIDDATASDLRPIWEAVVQGICLGRGQIIGETTVATALSTRLQELSLPINLSSAEEFVRVELSVTGDDTTATAHWFLDMDTVHATIGLTFVEDMPQESPFVQTDAVASSDTTSFAAHGPDGGPLDLLMDIPLEISVELGRVQMLVKDVLDLGTGSIVEIDKAAGEPVDVLVNGRPVARGEVVVIEDNFGVRITEILNTQERLAKLGDAA